MKLAKFYFKNMITYLSLSTAFCLVIFYFFWTKENIVPIKDSEFATVTVNLAVTLFFFSLMAYCVFLGKREGRAIDRFQINSTFINDTFIIQIIAIALVGLVCVDKVQDSIFIIHKNGFNLETAGYLADRYIEELPISAFLPFLYWYICLVVATTFGNFLLHLGKEIWDRFYKKDQLLQATFHKKWLLCEKETMHLW